MRTKIAISCFLGAFLGSFIALQFNQYFWWVGMIAGGFVGYIAFEFKELIQAIPTAWNRTMNGWPDRDFRKKIVLTLLGFFLMTLNVSLPAAALFACIIQLPAQPHETFHFSFQVFLMWFGWLGILIAIFMTSVYVAIIGDGIRQFDPDRLKHLIWHFSPVRIYGSVIPRAGWQFLLQTVKFILTLPSRLMRGVEAVVKFVWLLFKLVHSDLRLLCGLDAALGAGVGYFTGNPLLGGVIGGVIGLLNYELISKRLLKLVPVRDKV